MLLLLALLLAASPASGHPLGAFGVDSVTEVGLTPNRVTVRYRLHHPQASTINLRETVDTDGDGRISPAEEERFLEGQRTHFLESLALEVDGRPVALEGRGGRLALVREGQGLATAESEYVLEGPLPGPGEHRLVLRDGSFETVPGERALVVGASPGVSFEPPPAGKALDADIAFTVEPGAPAGVEPVFPRPEEAAAGEDHDELLRMLGGGGPTVLFAALALAFVLGALHALTPGHGKTMVAAYLVGSRGTVGQAVFLGVVVTFTHTFSVILLGVGCLFAFQYVVPERVIPWVGFGSGLLIAALGAWLLLRGGSGGHHHAHDEGWGTATPEMVARVAAAPVRVQVVQAPLRLAPVTPAAAARGHHHLPQKVTLLSLLALGVSGGIVPCTDALVVLLSAIALNRIAMGLLVLVAFSAGLASVLVATGIVMVKARSLLERFYPGGGFVARLTTASYAVVTLMGLGIAGKSLMDAGLI